MKNVINTEVINGTTYYTMTSRGVEYVLDYDHDVWNVHSKKLSLGRNNVGTHRFFSNLEALETKIKGLRGIAMVLGARSTVEA